MENKKNQQKQIINKPNSSRAIIDYGSFFQNKNFEHYVFKRIEKISLAVHLLSSLLMDNEPSKNRLKELAIASVSNALSLSDTGRTSQNLIRKILATLAEIHSIFEIIQISELISEMNCLIIKEEIAKLSNVIISNENFYHTNKSGFITEDFFATLEDRVDDRPKDFTSHLSSQIQDYTHKGQKDIKDSDVRYKNYVSDKGQTPRTQDDKNKRQETILDMLKDGKVLIVKDFSKEIKGCSEKTIQRELLSLVSRGILKKEGERRWSKYSLI